MGARPYAGTDRGVGANRSGGRRAVVGARVPQRGHDVDPRQRSGGTAGPRVDRPSDRARPRPRHGRGVCRFVVPHDRGPRHAEVRQSARLDHGRRHAVRRARLLRLRRRRGSCPARDDPGGRHLPELPDQPRDGARGRTDVQRHQPRGRLVAPAAHPDDEHLAGAARRFAVRDHRRHEGRHLHGDESVLVDRRQADQLPVRLRDRVASAERQADAALQEPQLHGDHAGVLGLVRRRGWSRGMDRVGHAELRQGPTRPGRDASVTARRPRASAASRSACADAGPHRRRPLPSRGRGSARDHGCRRRRGPLHPRMGRTDPVRQLRDPPVDVP